MKTKTKITYDVLNANDYPVLYAAKTSRKAKKDALEWADCYKDHQPQLVFFPFKLIRIEKKCVESFQL